MNKIIEVKDLKKSYGKVEAVRGISFYAEEGKLFSFLGPNGAGKSTTIDIICTLLQKDSGEIWIDGQKLGENDSEIRKKIGIVFQDGLLDPLLTVKENLVLRAGFYFSKKIEIKNAVSRALSETEILEFADRPYGKLSGGQRRRADIARALLNTPQILILDEPTTGLDPQTRKNIWQTIRRLQKETQMTVFLTTHYMEEAAESDYVIVIDAGLIAAKGAPVELKEKYARDLLKLTFSNEIALSEILKRLKVPYVKQSNQLIVELTSTIAAIPIIEACKDQILGIEVLQGTMDDAFIGIAGKEIRG